MAITFAPAPKARRPRKKPAATLARRRRDPGLRSKLPTSQLTASQRKERARLKIVARENANPLYDPTTQLGGHALIQSARDLADLEINPKVGALNQQLRSATTQGTALAGNAGDYYRQLAAREAQSVATQKAIGDMLNTQTAAVGQGTQQQFDQMSAQEQQRQASDTELRGTGLGGDTSRVPEEIAAQRGSAATLQQAAGNAAAQQGSEWSSLANAMAQSRQLHGGEVQGQLLNRVANQQQQIRGQRADVEATRGDLTTKALTGLRQQSFENLVTMKGLDIKTADLAAQVEGTQAQAKAAKAKTALDTKKFRADQAWRATQARGTAAKLRADTAYKNAQIDIKRGIDPVTGKRLPKDRKGKSSADRLNDFKLDYARKHGYLPPTGAPKAGQPGGPKAKAKSATPVQQSTFRRDASSALAVANALKGRRQNRHQAAAALTTPSKQFSKGLDPLTASVALDIAYDGHVSQYNVDRLHKAGISVSQLGWPTRRQWEKNRRRPRVTRPGGAAGAIPGLGATLGT